MIAANQLQTIDFNSIMATMLPMMVLGMGVAMMARAIGGNGTKKKPMPTAAPVKTSIKEKA